MPKKTRKKPKPFAPVRIAHSTQPNPKDTFSLLASVVPDPTREEPLVVSVPIPTDEEHVVVAVRRSLWQKITDWLDRRSE